MSDPNNNDTTNYEDAYEGTEEILDFKGKTFNMHFCPKAINGSYNCDYIYCVCCYDEVKPSGKRQRKISDKAKKPMEDYTAGTTSGGCDDHKKTLFNICDNEDRKYFLPSYRQGKTIPTHCKGCNKRIVVV